jgi:hypothetical protein
MIFILSITVAVTVPLKEFAFYVDIKACQLRAINLDGKKDKIFGMPILCCTMQRRGFLSDYCNG